MSQVEIVSMRWFKNILNPGLFYPITVELDYKSAKFLAVLKSNLFADGFQWLRRRAYTVSLKTGFW